VATNLRPDGRFKCREQFSGDLLLTGGLECLNAPLLLLVARTGLRLVRPAEAEKATVNRNINVLRESFDDFEHLGERRAALENQMLAKRRQPEQFSQRPANPEILFDYLRLYVARSGRSFEKNPSFLRF